MKKVKPPLGLVPPDYYWSEKTAERMDQISKAIKRYLDASLPIPEAWVEEWNNIFASE